MLVVYKDSNLKIRKVVVGVKALPNVLALIDDLGYELKLVERGL